MPRARYKGSLERSVNADLFKHTLSRIPTLYGRLSYLASLRDPNSGHYRHHGLMAMFGREESTRALTESHEHAFREWLNLPLSEKHADLQEYFRELGEPPAEVVRHWRHTRLYRTLVPASATEAENEYFSADLDMLMRGFNSGGGAGPDRAS
jgi:hypothetical protein